MARSCHGALKELRADVALSVALAGNPNVGKSSIFNRLTGMGVATANYPGKTVEVQLAVTRFGDKRIGVIDLPGTYALGGVSQDQWVARQALLDGAPDAVILVLDATNLARNLYLGLQVLDLGIPLQPRPFDFIARRSGIEGVAFFDAVRRFVDRGQLLRIAATVQQRRNPFQTNAMSVWSVDGDRIEAFVKAALDRSSVLRCYERPTYEDWPYNIFATVQARSIEECDAVVAQIADDTGATAYRTLYPTREHKNTRVSLFSGETAELERSRLAAGMADEVQAAS